MRSYIPLFARTTHLEYDPVRAKQWMADNPKVRSSILGNLGKVPVKTELPVVDSVMNMVESEGDEKGRLTAQQVMQIIPEWKATGATLAQARFSAEYCSNGFNATKAYKAAVNGNASYATMSVMASKYMQDMAVVNCIQTFTMNWIGERRLQLHSKILQTLWAQAFYDPSMFIKADGQPAFSDISEIPVDMRCVIVGIKKRYHGKDATAETIEVELVDRRSSIRELAAYVNLMKDAKATPTITLSADGEAMLTSVFATAMGATKNLKTIPSLQDLEVMTEQESSKVK